MDGSTATTNGAGGTMPSPAPGADDLAAAAAALARVRAIDPRTLPADTLAAQVAAAAALVDVAEAVLVQSLAAFDEQELWRADGAGGARSWLAFRTGDRAIDCGRRVRAAALATRWPAIGEALGAGVIREGHVTILSRVAIPARRDVFARDLDVLLTAAAALDLDPFEQAVCRWASYADDELDRPPRSEREHLDRRRLRLRDLTNGMVAVDGLLTAGAAVIVRAALEHLDEPDRRDAPDGPRTPAQRAADHLVELARLALAGPDVTSTADPTVVVTVSTDVLAGDPDITARFADPDVRSGLADGHPLPPETIRRFTCGSWLSGAVFSGANEVLALGRRRRRFSAAQRRAIVARDGGCVFPGCDRPARWCEAHHLDPWGPPTFGPTDLDNGCLLCWHHHTLVHEGGWALRHDPDGGWTCFNPRREAVDGTDRHRRRRPPPDGPVPPRRPSTARHHQRARSPDIAGRPTG